MQRRLLRLVQRVGIQRRDDGRLGTVHFVRKIRVLEKFLKVHLAHRRAAFHGPMILCRGQRIRFSGLAHRCAGLNVFAGENFAGIEADARADPPCPFAAVTEREAE